jgi:hypothetical protein
MPNVASYFRELVASAEMLSRDIGGLVAMEKAERAAGLDYIECAYRFGHAAAAAEAADASRCEAAAARYGVQSAVRHMAIRQ